MIDTTNDLPIQIRESLADQQPIQWIPLPGGPGHVEMMIPAKTRGTPRLIAPWELDRTLTTPATQVYRFAQGHLAAMVHGNTLSLVKASDETTLTHTLKALSHPPTRTNQPDRDHPRAPEHHERSR